MLQDFPHTRWSLVARIGNDPSGLHELLSLYAPAIARYLAQKFPNENASGQLDDVVQETLVALLERPELLARAKPAEGSRFRYLVMTTAYYLARNAMRRLQRPSHTVAHDESAAAPVPLESLTTSSIAEMDRAWAEGVIARAWDDVRAWAAEGQLEPGAVELLFEHLTQDRSLRDLVQRSGLSLATCQRRVARGRMLLQRAIVDRLRASNELPAGTDPAAAYDILVGLLRR